MCKNIHWPQISEKLTCNYYTSPTTNKKCDRNTNFWQRVGQPGISNTPGVLNLVQTFWKTVVYTLPHAILRPIHSDSMHTLTRNVDISHQKYSLPIQAPNWKVLSCLLTNQSIEQYFYSGRLFSGAEECQHSPSQTHTFTDKFTTSQGWERRPPWERSSWKISFMQSRQQEEIIF